MPISTLRAPWRRVTSFAAMQAAMVVALAAGPGITQAAPMSSVVIQAVRPGPGSTNLSNPTSATIPLGPGPDQNSVSAMIGHVSAFP